MIRWDETALYRLMLSTMALACLVWCGATSEASAGVRRTIAYSKYSVGATTPEMREAGLDALRKWGDALAAHNPRFPANAPPGEQGNFTFTDVGSGSLLCQHA